MFDDHVSQEKAGASKNEGIEPSGLAPCGSGYPLAMAKDNELLTIAAMHGGRQYRRQLMDMGLRPGMKISVLRAGGKGPVLIAAGQTRLGIGRGMAEKIEVVPVCEAKRD